MRGHFRPRHGGAQAMRLRDSSLMPLGGERHRGRPVLTSGSWATSKQKARSYAEISARRPVGRDAGLVAFLIPLEGCAPSFVAMRLGLSACAMVSGERANTERNCRRGDAVWI